MNQADLILYNGSIYTIDAAQGVCDALAIAGERIIGVGDEHTLRPMLGPEGQEIDLQGRTVIPGLIDSHLHFVGYSLRLEQVDLEGVPTLDEALRLVTERASQAEPGTWIRGGGWNCNRWGDGAFPHRRDLDRVAPNNPVLLSSKDGHSTWINSRAMHLAHISAETPDPPGGSIRRTVWADAGEPAVHRKDPAFQAVYSPNRSRWQYIV